MSKFKVGDAVKVVSRGHWDDGHTGTIVRDPSDEYYVVISLPKEA